MIDLLEINNIDYTKHVVDGFQIKRTATEEELNSAIFTLACIDELDIQPFDNVRMIVDEEEFEFVINTYQNEICIFGDEFNSTKYNYTIAAVSKEKLLERVIMPNLTITTHRNGTRKSIVEYIERIVIPYIEKTLKIDVSISEELRSKLENAYCKEFSWGTPNAKQVLNDLLSMYDKDVIYITFIKDKLSYISLNERRNEIDKSLIVEQEDSQQMSEYANEIVVESKNVLNAFRSTAKCMTLRSKDSWRLEDNSASLIIDGAKIDKIISFEMAVSGSVTNPNTNVETTLTNHVFDLTPFVVEESVFESLDSTLLNAVSYDWDTAKTLKVSTVTFKHGGNSIDGLLDKINSQTKQDILVAIAINRYFPKYRYDLTVQFYNVEYENISDFRVSFYSDDKRNNAQLSISQNQAFVDFNTFARQQQDYVKRVGNKTFSKTFMTKSTNAPQLFQTLDNSNVLTKISSSYFDDCVISQCDFSQNYVNRVRFQGISARTRFSNYITGSDAVTREHTLKVKYTFNKIESNLEGTHLVDWWCNKGDPQDYHIDYLQVRSKLKNFSDREENTVDFLLHAHTNYSNDKILITAECVDNIVIGMQRESETDRTQRYVKYVDENGEMFGFDALLLHCNYMTENQRAIFPLMKGDVNNEFLAYNSVYNVRFNKDNREKLKITYDILYAAEEGSGIIVGNDFNDSSPYVHNIFPQNRGYVIKYNANSLINEKTKQIDENWQTVSNCNFIHDNEYNGIFIPSIPTQLTQSGSNSIAICKQSTNEIVLGINGVDIGKPFKFHLYVKGETEK